MPMNGSQRLRCQLGIVNEGYVGETGNYANYVGALPYLITGSRINRIRLGPTSLLF
jgi:hypothetical protein